MTATKTEDTKGNEIFRAISSKTKKDRVTKIRFELGTGEIKKIIQKSRLRWFGHVIRMATVRTLITYTLETRA